ncbi:unnamed protein product [Toxocara canis]|uniref:RNA methyltransferase n=1 Tax=Toxocara canis TaxID=6265 RepID=A0A183UKT4_TOXCA|nr:unnamed protein product [Toxocara canis]
MSSATKECAGGGSSESGITGERPKDGDVGEQQRGKRSQRSSRGRRGGGSGAFRRRYTGDAASWGAKRRRCGDVGEMPFLHGGNIKDPLNLESVKPVDEAEIMKPLEVIIPKNMHDPLNLRSITKNRNKRKRKNSKQGECVESPTGMEDEQRRRSNTFVAFGDHRQSSDAIVSPVPVSVVRKFSAAVAGNVQRQRGHKGDGSWKRYCEPSGTLTPASYPHVSATATSSSALTSQRMQEPGKPVVTVCEQPSSNAAVEQRKPVDAQEQGQKMKQKERFRYGNFNRYYGTRLEDGGARDPRLFVLKKEWFKKKAVLDVGCNAGYITLSIAKDFEPRRILGIDIDEHLVGVARKNIRHYCDNDTAMSGSFPASFARRYGPISVHSTKFSTKFPDNVWFRRENYVLDNDECLNQVCEEFDVILALSITKWVHLNWGDAGLKRFFRRAFLQLRPGGLFILEPQAFDSYKKRARMTPEVQETFKSIQFLPDAFQEFLLCEVGFESCEHLEAPKAKSKGTF